MTIFCDESGGIGRGVMTLAAVLIDDAEANALLAKFRVATGLRGELKGSRVDLDERAQFFALLATTSARACIGIAISALHSEPGVDRGRHDRLTYATLLDHSVAAVLPLTGGCAHVIIDDGRYDDLALAAIRDDIATLIGPCGRAAMELSHRAAGLQIADVIANSFFNRALATPRQGAMAAAVAPMLASGRFWIEILTPQPHPSAPSSSSNSTNKTNTIIDAIAK